MKSPYPAPRACLALLLRLERWLTDHRPRYLQGLFPAASEADLNFLESALGACLPEELRTLLSWHNGQRPDFVGSFEQSWNLMGTRAISEAKREMDGDNTGVAAKGGWQSTWIPLLDDDAGDYLCLDASQREAPVYAFWFGEAARPPIAPSLTTWLEDFVTGVERGEYHEDPERGFFLRMRKE